MEFEELFDGTLGEWETNPVSLELKDSAKPYCKPYPVPRFHEDTLKNNNKDYMILKYLNGSPSRSGLHHHL